MRRIVRVRAGPRQCHPSLARVHCARRVFLGRVSAEREKGLHSLRWGFFKTAIVIASTLPVPLFSFLSRLIDTALMQRHSVMSLSTLWGYESPQLSVLLFPSVPGFTLSFIVLPVLKLEEIAFTQAQPFFPYSVAGY